MLRIRIVFALLAVALAVPAGFLIRRALESVEVERAVRHRAVVERVFDELERSLSDFLRTEEERPVEHYRFAYLLADALPARSGSAASVLAARSAAIAAGGMRAGSRAPIAASAALAMRRLAASGSSESARTSCSMTVGAGSSRATSAV